jgi:hypothetical protein
MCGMLYLWHNCFEHPMEEINLVRTKARTYFQHYIWISLRQQYIHGTEKLGVRMIKSGGLRCNGNSVDRLYIHELEPDLIRVVLLCFLKDLRHREH